MPGITLDNFRASVKEVARPNRFLLSMPRSPATVDFDDEARYHVRTASIPSRTIGDISNLFWQGMNYKIAGDPIYDDYNIMFLNNSNFRIREMLESWVDLISNSVTNVRTSHEDYKGIIRLDQLGVGDETDIIASYFLHGIYPKAVDAIELSHEASDTIEEFSVTFSIDYWNNDIAPDSGEGIVLLP